MDARLSRRRKARTWRGGGLAAAGAFVWLAGALDRPAEATQFHSPPTIDDRRVHLTWSADADDPIFTGAIVLETTQEYPFIHGVDRPIVDIVALNLVPELVSYARGENVIQRWQRSDGAILQTVELGSESFPLDLSVHGSNRFLLAAHEDGRAEFWDLAAEEPDSRFLQISPFPLRRVEFFPGILDEEDLRFVAAGEDTLVYVYEEPGDLLFTMRIPGGGTQAIAVSAGGRRLVTGGRDARLRVWDITTRPNSPFTFFVNHRGTVRDIVIDPLGRRMASVDETGLCIISVLETGVELGRFEVDVSAGPPKLGFSVPNGAVLSVALANGRLALYDGNNGQFFRDREISPDGLSAYAVSPDGQRNITGDRDGRIRLVRAGRCQPSAEDPVCFGGYKIWRNTVADTAGAMLLREYRFDAPSWTLIDQTHSFVDPDSIEQRVAPPGEEDPVDEVRLSGPHNGVPYFYSITRFDRQFLNGSVFDVNQNTVEEGFYRDPGSTEPTPIVPVPGAREDAPLLGEVHVVPNPYESGQVPWDAVGGEHVEFRNLPAVATIQIFTIAGDLVRVIEHGRDRYGEARSAASWDLRNSTGRRITSGVYIYRIEAESGEVIDGYFIVVL